MSRDLRGQASEVLRVYGEIGRRVSATGVDGISGLLELHGRLERALRDVSAKEVEWALDRIKGVLDEMIRVDSELRRLQRILVALDLESGEPMRPAERASG